MAKQLSLNLNLQNMFVGFIPDRRLKMCSHCLERKSVIEFGKDNRTSDGKANVCRDCRRKYRRSLIKNYKDMELKFRTLKANEIDCRLAQVAKTGSGMFLLYKDARVDMAMLDEVVGPTNWKREHTRDNANCIVSIWDTEKSQWISKEDTGTESNTEKEKGLASDSFKRACFNWGIGRELYTAPTIWVKPNNGEDIKYVKLKCSKIGYNEKREICMLELVDEKGVVRYKFGNGQIEQKPQLTAEQKQMKDIAMKDVASSQTIAGLEDVWKSNGWLHTDAEFKNAVINKKKELQ